MATTGTLLCIHRDPVQLGLLQDHGYDLVTATNGHEGLRLFMSQPVDGIVLEYHLGLLNGAVIAAEIRKVRPTVPIVLLADHLELPDDALKSVDALVAKSDGPHFLLAAVHFVLHVRPEQPREEALRTQRSSPLPPACSLESRTKRSRAKPASRRDEKGTFLSTRVWKSIRNGNVQF